MDIGLPKDRLIFDCEANGLLKATKDSAAVTNVWCIGYKIHKEDKPIVVPYTDLSAEYIVETFKNKFLIGHNIIDYDIPLIEKFYGINLIDLVGHDKIIDTLLWSQVAWPDRPLPKNCPTSIYNPVIKKSRLVTPHGLDAWGYRVGFKKLKIHDWTVYTPDILKRNEVDVIINEKVFEALCNEMGIKV